jgi:hypothetical protein
VGPSPQFVQRANLVRQRHALTSRPMKRRILVASVSALVLSLSACSSSEESTSSTSTAADAGNASEQLRDQRYCEIIPATRDKATISSEVYNTLGLNDCPAEVWVTITEDTVNEEYGSLQAKINGPRHWMMDTIIGKGQTVDSPTFTFGGPSGIEMQRRAVIETKVGEDTVGDAYYVPNAVQRDTVFVYNAGQPVFELTDPDGQTYMMQSYSQIVDPELSYDQLADLGARLALPDGWTYSTRVLEEEFQLTTEQTEGIAYVINDDLVNSYQRAS